LDFHFEGGFSSVMGEGGFGEDEIEKWVSMSYLYACCVAHAFVTPDRSKDAFLLLEDLYTSVSICRWGLGWMIWIWIWYYPEFLSGHARICAGPVETAWPGA